MTDCAPDPGWGPFKGWDKKDRIKVATDAIEIVKKYHSRGMAISLDLSVAHLIPHYGQFESDYTFACYQALLAVRYWCRDNNFDGDIAYIFESGHESQSESNGQMDKIFQIPSLRAEYRYGSHSFIPKKKSLPLQAADILAWLWGNQLKLERRKNFNGKLRADLYSLVERDHFIAHYDKAKIDKWMAEISQRQAILKLKQSLCVPVRGEEMFLSDGLGPRGPMDERIGFSVGNLMRNHDTAQRRKAIRMLQARLNKLKSR